LYLPKEIKVKKNLQKKVCPRGTPNKPTVGRGLREDKKGTVPPKISQKLVNKNAVKPEKGVPYPHKFGRNLTSGPSQWIFKPFASMLIVKLPVRVIERVL
jgi:hypothetical protein